MNFLQIIFTFCILTISTLRAEPNTEASWLTGSDANDATLEIKGKLADNTKAEEWEKKNVIWSEGVTNGSKYWEIKFAKFSTGDVGVTTIEAFKPGWNLTGLLYSGNLNNGTEILEPDFGPPLHDGDIVGIQVQIKNKTVAISFYHNGRYIGQGFSVPITGISKLHPVVSFEGPGSAELLSTVEAPKEDVFSKESMASYVGAWVFNASSLYCEDEKIPIPADIQSGKANATLRMSLSSEDKNKTEFSVALKVANTMKFPLMYDVAKAQWTTPGTRVSSNVNASAEIINFERWLGAFTYDPEDIKVERFNNTYVLIMSNDDCVMQFKKTFIEPIQNSPFV